MRSSSPHVLSGVPAVSIANTDDAHLPEEVGAGFPTVRLLFHLSPLYTPYSLQKLLSH